MATIADQNADRIALANETSFRLGGLHVTPALRQIGFGDESRTIEPRVMQVLVVLARAQGAIVGRDELIERCWDGRVVGENAINRVISILRTLAAETAAFEIDTITKVGYRLRADPASVRTAATTAAEPGFSPARRAAMASIGAALTAGGAWLFWPDDMHGGRSAAEQHYLAGVDSERMGEAGVKQAIAHYEAAVRADPGFAAGWGALARALAAASNSVAEDQVEPIARRVHLAAQHALQIEPGNRDALLATVTIEPMFRNWADLERLARDALMRRPDLDEVRARLAVTLANTGRYREALALMRQVVARQPLLPASQLRLGWLLWQTGKPEEARRIFDQAYRIWPLSRSTWLFRVMFLGITGSTVEALAMTSGSVARTAASGPLPAPIAAICTRALSRDAGASDRQTAVDALRASRRAGDIGSFVSVVYLGALGEIGTAFEHCYDYFLGKRDPSTGERRPLPRFADRWTDFLFAIPMTAVRADPRFLKLTTAIGLEDYWRDTGSRPDYRAS